jgi:predicted permease
MTRLLLALTRLLPPALRRAHGRELRSFITEARARRTMSAWQIASDLIVSIAREWIDAVARRRDRATAAGDRRPTLDLIHGVTRDVRHAGRLLARSPGFTIAAVLTLALGIGGNTAMYALADATVLRPLHVAQPERLVAWSWTSAYPDFKAYAARRDVFDGVLAISTGGVAIEADGASELVSGAFVSGNALDVLGVGVGIGRPLVAADDILNTAVVGVLSDDYWRSRFGGDRSIIGRVVRINSQPVTIVGVAEPGFRGISVATAPSIYVPLTAATQLRTGPFARPAMFETRNMVWLTVVGRLRSDVTAAQAAAAMDSQYRSWEPGEAGATERLRLIPLTTRALGGDGSDKVQRFVVLLVGVVALTLLIGCANLANLLIARSAARRAEVGVRLALGASRAHIARQSLVESFLLACLGGTAGLAVAAGAVQVLGAYQLPDGIDIKALRLTLDSGTFAAAAVLTLVTAALFGVAPAWGASGVDVIASLRRGSNRHSGGDRVRAVLVAVQVALCLVLLTGSGLLLRSLLHALDVPLGVVTASINPGLARHDAGRARAYQAEALARVRALPAVAAAAWATFIPSNGQMFHVVDIDGAAPGSKPPDFQVSLVGPEYFGATGTRLLQGRPFTSDDRAGAEPVAIVSHAAAKTHWAGRDAVGGRIKPGGSDRWHTVVGVVDDVLVGDLGDTPPPLVYYPFGQPIGGPLGPLDAAHLLVRGTGDAEALQAAVARTLRDVDAGMPLYDIVPFAEHVRELLMPQRLGLMLMTFFSVLTLTLAAVGIYGVATYVAELRAAELSIRIALGADRAAIRRLVLWRGVMPAAAGIAVGLLLALWASQLLHAFLYDVSPRDPLTFVSASVGLLLLAVLATWWPARRAARVDPMAALRQI